MIYMYKGKHLDSDDITTTHDSRIFSLFWRGAGRDNRERDPIEIESKGLEFLLVIRK